MTPPAILWFCAPVGLLLSALTAALAWLVEWMERRRWHGCNGGGHWR